jgi:hypothetical protein
LNLLTQGLSPNHKARARASLDGLCRGYALSIAFGLRGNNRWKPKTNVVPINKNSTIMVTTKINVIPRRGELEILDESSLMIVINAKTFSAWV